MAGIYSQGGSAGHRYAGWLSEVEAKNFQFGGKVFNGSPSAIYVGSNLVWAPWLLKDAALQSILGAFGQRDGMAVINATNAYLNQLAASGQAGKDKATALSGFINQHPLDAALYGGLYVQDGLSFVMDRAYMLSASKWYDFINDIEFTGNGAVQIVDDVPYFNGSAWYNNAQNLSYAASSCTIEVVFTREKTGRANLLDNNLNGTIGFLFYSYYQGIGSNGASSTRFVARDTLGEFTRVGIAGSLGIQDGVAMTTQGSNYWGASSSGTTIGGGREKWQGKIYAIRIYNRLLTEAEILANQDIDLKRFTPYTP